MEDIRKIRNILRSRPTVEGAGVRLKRVFGHPEVPLLDPFLLLDDFHSSDPGDYMAGFPWHPHRGIETITYMLHGTVAHGDSMGNSGKIRDGDVQWMTAGSGIIHQEMPQRSNRTLWGFQLWANLPASHKMTAPCYRNVKRAQIPQVSPRKNVTIKIICGEAGGVKGPVQDIVTDPEYLDITIGPDGVLEHPIQEGYTAFSYVVGGEGYFDKERQRLIPSENLVLFDNGRGIRITAAKEPVRFLLISGKPIREPVAWSGPIVMNTKEALEIAFEEYRNGTFLKHN
ncbi:MAG: pirin family protein [Nitrospiria bacterium]